jgi:hypothetical protein
MAHGITPENLYEFKNPWTEVFDEDLDSVEAVVIATHLIGFYRLIMRLLPPAAPTAPAPPGT